MTGLQPSFASADDTEVAFYTAFNRCDLSAMETIWADDDVVCIHPGSSAIMGQQAVLRSWSHIFTNAELPEIQVNVISRIDTETMSAHIVEEHIASAGTGAVVLATNIYKKYVKGWLMVEHHAAVTKAPLPPGNLQ